MFAHLGDVEGPFGHEDRRRAAGRASHERDPSRVPTHDLDHHHSVVAFRRCVQSVDRVGGDLNRGVKPE